MTAYYNEFDPYAAAWLRDLIAAGEIAPGDVDERSITDVPASDLTGYTQCHFFAGIGGWSLALRLAGWPDDRRVWTGSCPCQPLSSAGQRKGHADERHLWPTFYSLIVERTPPVVFGEQVASQDGREWLAGVRADLEALGYACGAADLCAAGVGAPHRRQRIFWVANPANDGHQFGVLGDQAGAQRASLGSGEDQGCRRDDAAHESGARVPGWNGPTRSIDSPEGRSRISAEPRAFPLADGVPARMGRLRAYGNAIVPQVAAEVIGAFMDVYGVPSLERRFAA